MTHASAPAEMGTAARPASLWALFAVFARISLTSFGGGLSGWLYRELVVGHRWLGEDEFYDAMALAQALPGVNVVNISIWVGYRMFGLAGAVTCFAGIVAPAAVTVVLIASMFALISHSLVTTLALTGASAAAIALPLQMGIKAALSVPRRVVPLLVMAASFLAIVVLHLPVVDVVLAMGAVSVAASYAAIGREAASAPATLPE